MLPIFLLMIFEVLVLLCLDTLISLVRLLLLDVQGTGRLALVGILGEAGGAWVGNEVVRGGILHLEGRLLGMLLLDGVVNGQLIYTVDNGPVENIVVIIAFFVQQV